MLISKALAEQIVSAVHDVVRNDINLIDENGTIIGSTNEQRIGTFHEAGFFSITEGKPIIVTDQKEYQGTCCGINYPIILEGKAIAAIGISGEPTELEQFGFLITKITEVFLKEQKLNEELLSKNRRLQYLITSLIHNTVSDWAKIYQALDDYNIDQQEDFIVLSIKVLKSEVEQGLKFYFQNLGVNLSLYLYPNEWVVIFEKKAFSKFSTEEFQKAFAGQVNAGLGTFESVSHIHQSYHFARIARSHAKKVGETFCDSGDITIEIIRESLPQEIQQLYAQRILKGLSEKEKELLLIYFQQNLSLKSTAETLFVHKNTLQYQLEKIKEKSGLNPRAFQDAFLLQFALMCDK